MTTAVLASGTQLADLFSHPFMRNAFLAGVPIAALAGLSATSWCSAARYSPATP